MVWLHHSLPYGGPDSMFLLYSLLYSIVMLILLPFEYMKRPLGSRKRWLREKLGWFSPTFEIKRQVIWIHAVSVGEVIAAVPFIRALEVRYPSARIAVSTITDTGQQVARERLPDSIAVFYLPFDLVSVIRRLLTRMRPSVFMTIETELWPNTFRLLKREGIPVLILNGRISDRSFSGYRKIRFFIRKVIRCAEVFCMQDETYAERIRALGADEVQIAVTGNFKFDVRPSEKIPGWSTCLEGLVIVAGSTHEGEEELVLSVFQKLRVDMPGLRLILAPRHPVRFRRVEDIVAQKGLDYMKRSEFADTPPVSSGRESKSGPPVVILDAIGELASLYGACDIAIIGGSFIPHGGHNPLEPAFWGKPIVCGPHMENFGLIEEFYKRGCAVSANAEDLYAVMRDLLLSPEKRKAMGSEAERLYREKAGAVGRALQILERYIN